MGTWSALTDLLRETESSADLRWDELEGLVGELPPSASRHRAWWSGERPHVRAWRSAGFRVSNLALGQSVTFVRTPIPVATNVPGVRPTSEAPMAPLSGDLVLIACVKTKLDEPAPAKELYVSPLFHKQREYAESSGAPWFILSAEYGLCRPDDWLSPYERYLPDTSPEYRTAWGAFVVARLELIAGSLSGRRIEVHAGRVYIAAIRGEIERRGGALVTPLNGLSMGQRLHWYNDTTQEASPERNDAAPSPWQPHVDLRLVADELKQERRQIDPHDFLTEQRTEWRSPGLYSWWVDDQGAADLSKGLGLTIERGLIYAGLAGATRWPSGTQSKNTLWSRIRTMHLGGNHGFSTFRLTLGSVLANAGGHPRIDEALLTEWMLDHLRVIAIPHSDPDTLGRLESDILAELDPPLNLQGRPQTPARRRLTELRKQFRQM